LREDPVPRAYSRDSLEAKRKWEELEPEMGREPAWLIIDTTVRLKKWVKAKCAEVRRRIYVEGSVFEKVLPKGFYGVEIWKKGYEAAVFRAPHTVTQRFPSYS